MMQLDTWVSHISDWYQQRKHDQVSDLESLILSAPDPVWGPSITDLQSKAIACWLDGCLRIFHHHRHTQPDKAFQYLQLAYSKLQHCVCQPLSELELKDWCMKRMQHLTVLSLEFCNQQQPHSWHKQSQALVEAHVSFMASQHWNDDQGKTANTPSLH